MKKNPNLKYYILLLLGFILVVSVQYNAPKPINWMQSYTQQDKIPYGCYIFREELPKIFPNNELVDSKTSSYNSLNGYKNTNYIIVNNKFSPDALDANHLLSFVEEGNQLFIAASDIGGKFADTLNIKTISYPLFNDIDSVFDNSQQFSMVNFVNFDLKKPGGYTYSKKFWNAHFTSVDSTSTTILGIDNNSNVNFVKIKFGKGNIFINTLPITFTNYFMLDSNNFDYSVKTLSYLPNQNTIWDEYYKSGRRIITSPIRFILGEPSLRMAYLVLIFGLLIYIVFNMKRKQRIIPVLDPLNNTTLDFVDIVGTIYYQNKDHYNLSDKKVLFFLEMIRSTYLLKTNELDEDFIMQLSRKSGVSFEEVKILITTIKKINNKMTEHDLIRLNNLIKQFHKNKIR